MNFPIALRFGGDNRCVSHKNKPYNLRIYGKYDVNFPRLSAALQFGGDNRPRPYNTNI